MLYSLCHQETNIFNITLPFSWCCLQVEAKRAVPRSEVSRDSALKANGSTPASNSNSPNLRPSGGNNWSGPTSGSVSPAPSNGSNSALTQSQIQNESRHACDPRISMDEYAYNKIFVGGLHYDTRDGECTVH